MRNSILNPHISEEGLYFKIQLSICISAPGQLYVYSESFRDSELKSTHLFHQLSAVFQHLGFEF